MAARHNVLCVSKSTGGIAVYNRELATHLARLGHNVHVVCLSEGREQYARELEALGLGVTMLHMHRYKIGLISDFVVAMRIRRYMRANRVSIAIAHGAKAGFLTRLAGRLTDTPVFYVQHSMPFLRRIQGTKAGFFRQIERIGTRLGGRIVALTRSMREHIVDNRVAPASRIDVVYTGIDPDGHGTRRDRQASCRALGLDPDRPVVVWAGRFSPQKAPEDFVAAAALVIESVPHAQLFMAGEGPLAPVIEQLAQNHSIGANLILAPWQTDVAVMLSACDVYVMTSHWEGLPLSLLEAMALQCPVVATSVDGVAEIIRNDVDGLLVPAGDSEALARQTVRLLSDEALRLRIGHAARRRIQEAFSVDQMTAKWSELIAAHARN